MKLVLFFSQVKVQHELFIQLKEKEKCEVKWCLFFHVIVEKHLSLIRVIRLYKNTRRNLQLIDRREALSDATFTEWLSSSLSCDCKQRPEYVAHCWREVLALLKPAFPSMASLNAIYDELWPSNTKVIEKLKAVVNNDQERDSLKHLKRYIRGLD